MKCILCGKEIPEGMSECPSCGVSVNVPDIEATNKPEEVVQEEIKPVEPVVETPVEDKVVEVNQVDTVSQDNASMGTVNIDNVPNEPIPTPGPITPNYNAAIETPTEESSSIVPIIFIIIIVAGIGFVGWLLLSGHNVFGSESITEDLPTTTTLPTKSVEPTEPTVVNPTEPTTTTSSIENTTVPVNLEDEKFVTDISNYTLSSTIKMTISNSSLTITMSGVVDSAHKKDHYKTTTMASGAIASIDAYYDYNTGYLYMADNNNKTTWYKQRTNEQPVDLAGYINKLNSMKNVTKVGDGHYKIKITKEELKETMSQSGVDPKTITGEPELHVYTSNGYITKVEGNFSKMVSGVDNFTIVNTFSKYDKSGDVVIPQDIISNAKNM